jgi:hypothetical protein
MVPRTRKAKKQAASKRRYQPNVWLVVARSTGIARTIGGDIIINSKSTFLPTPPESDGEGTCFLGASGADDALTYIPDRTRTQEPFIAFRLDQRTRRGRLDPCPRPNTSKSSTCHWGVATAAMVATFFLGTMHPPPPPLLPRPSSRKESSS